MCIYNFFLASKIISYTRLVPLWSFYTCQWYFIKVSILDVAEYVWYYEALVLVSEEMSTWYWKLIESLEYDSFFLSFIVHCDSFNIPQEFTLTLILLIFHIILGLVKSSNAVGSLDYLFLIDNFYPFYHNPISWLSAWQMT